MRMKDMMLWAIIAAGAVVLSTWNVDMASSSVPLEARALGANGVRAFETQHGTIITDSEDKARWAEKRLNEAASNFSRIFGALPGRGVIVELPYASYIDDIPKSQKRWTLPWMPQYFGSGIRTNVGLAGHHFDNDSGILHELNHVFFTASVIPNTKGIQYGSDAPDWLDEAVALAAETPAVKSRRRSHFHDQVCAGRLVPLNRFLAQPHPLFLAPEMQKLVTKRRAAADGAPVMMTIGLDKLKVSQDSMMDFYAQSNAVSEFLAEISGDPTILSRIARSLQKSADKQDLQNQSWIRDVAVSTDQPLEPRFAAWAKASASADKTNCATSASGT